MTDASAIAGIEARLRDDPDDGEAWWVYGDHLGDLGDPRGELVALARSGTAEGLERAKGLAQELALEGRRQLNGDDWVIVRDRDWRHGFVLAVSLTIDHPGDIRSLERALAAPCARLLRSLTLRIGPSIPARHLAKLAELQLGCLRELSITEQPRGDAALRSLVGACTQLATLDCRGAGLTHNGAIALAELASSGTLRRLHAHRNRIRGKGVAAIAPKLAGLELLDLRDNDIGRAGLAALAETPALGSLRTLRLQLETFALDDLRILADSATLPRPIVRYVRGVLEQRSNQP